MQALLAEEEVIANYCYPGALSEAGTWLGVLGVSFYIFCLISSLTLPFKFFASTAEVPGNYLFSEVS